MEHGTITNYNIAKAYYSDLDDNKKLLNADGYLYLNFEEIYNETSLSNFFEYISNAILGENSNGIICIYNKPPMKNVIKLESLLKCGFIKTDEDGSQSIYVLKSNTNAPNPTFKK